MLVAPMAQLEHGRLVDVLQHGIPAVHVAVDGGVADGHFRLVAGGQQHMAELVGQRHQQQAPRAGLNVFFRDVAVAAFEQGGQHGVEGVHGGLDRHAFQPGAHEGRRFGGVLQAVGGGIGRGHHHRQHTVRPQGVDRDGGGKGTVDTARQAQNHTGKTVLVHVIAEPQHHGAVDGFRVVGGSDDRRRFGPEGLAVAGPGGQGHRTLPAGHLGRQGAVRVEHEGAAVEHQFVLSADQVGIQQRQARFLHAADRIAQALVVLLHVIGGSVQDDQHLGPRFIQAFGHVLEPHVFADHDTQARAPERHRAGQGALLEQALFVEHAVIG